MGLPVEGSSIGWSQTEQAAPIIRKWATEQLLCIWNEQRDRNDSIASWGDEVEYCLVDLSPETKRATLVLDHERIIRQWEKNTASKNDSVTLQWEWAKYMVEATPAKPYTGKIDDLMAVEQNMKRRRQVINNYLSSNQHTLSLSFFPRAGADGQWTTPCAQNKKNHSICSLPRYRIVPENVLCRGEGCKKTNLPIFQDSQTPNPFYDISQSGQKVEGHLGLDDPEIGIGCCSLQVTLQASDQANARWLHDQLIPLAPIMLAMTAAVPIWKGYLVDTDVRWQRFGDLLDDRREEEMETTPPRWTWNRNYLSLEKPPGFDNGSSQPIDPAIKQRLLEGDMDESLATHFASILSRDPLIMTEADMNKDNTSNTKLFELLYGFTWHAVKFKPPTSDNGPGWCVELRTMESQLTDRANAAFAIFTYLLTRAITTLHLNFYIPIDKVGESMDIAKNRDAVRQSKMWFRRRGWLSGPTHTVRPVRSMCKENACSKGGDGKSGDFGLMTANEIFNGELDDNGFPGLIPIVRYYLDYSKMPLAEQERVAPYLDFISQRASGEDPTPATWMREFVRSHKDYKHDSYVGESICYDMMQEIVGMNEE
ncbi:Glutamate-cysteine ligase catalytic subunit [Penicillium brevicompactum]|uniref:Glutamate--cysteine ligase n=1 Tax=Penicillium brevicompactum TaxID=5074 RepID=A0A9W9QU33_PENBR|nr:Glutamate-cysteine ligase catalytic subunit [Penicillium brevicompactum]